MVLITGTNIVVDEFDYGKRTPWIRYIYFLTHYHAGIAYTHVIISPLAIDKTTIRD